MPLIFEIAYLYAFYILALSQSSFLLSLSFLLFVSTLSLSPLIPPVFFIVLSPSLCLSLPSPSYPNLDLCNGCQLKAKNMVTVQQENVLGEKGLKLQYLEQELETIKRSLSLKEEEVS